MLSSTSFHHVNYFPQQEMRTLLLLQATGLVGREQEIRAIGELLKSESIRLLTITGREGGEDAAGLPGGQSGGQGFCGWGMLGFAFAVKDPVLVLYGLAQELGMAEDGEEPLLVRVQRFCRRSSFCWCWIILSR